MLCNYLASSSSRLMMSRHSVRILSSSSSTAGQLKSLNDVPGPIIYPIVDNMVQMLLDARNQSGSSRSTPFYQKYGPIWRWKVRDFYMVNIHEPRDYEKVSRAEGKNPFSSVLYMWPFHEYNEVIGYGDSNLLGLKGEQWRKIRMSMQTEIFGVKASRSYADLFEPIVDDAVRMLPEKRVSLGDLVPRLTFEMIGAILFNRRLGSLEYGPGREDAPTEKFIHAVLEVMRTCDRMINIPMKSLARALYWKPFKKSMDIMYNEGDRYVAIIEDALTKDPESEEFKQAAASYVGKNLLAGHLTKEQLASNINTFLFAGVDTTAASIRWLLVNLAQNPQVQENLYQEFSTHLQGRTITSSDLDEHEFPYFRATQKESFRISPTLGGLIRILPVDIEIQGYLIPKGTMISYVPFPILHDPKRIDSPEVFSPERWLPGADLKIQDDGVYSTFSQLQFGFGPRQCLGAKVANIEIMMFFSRLIQDFKFELDPPTQKWERITSLTSVPHPMPTFKFTPRK